MASTEEIDISIIICTRNRAEHLRKTLDSLGELQAIDHLSTELILVDNGSNDHTGEVARAFHTARLPVRLISEPQPGLSRARNAGLRATRGNILLFTDDDVRVPPDWIARMTAPIRAGRADAVAGGVVLAPHLRRPWMTPQNTNVLATTATIDLERPERMVGANMAFAREVLYKVPAFDTELGVGTTIGSGEETLFSKQLQQAGFRIVSAFDVAVEHHCDPSRLSRAAYQAAWERVGRSQAYIDYHWYHTESAPRKLYPLIARMWPRLAIKRLVDRNAARQKEGSPPWERPLMRTLHYARQLLIEQRRPRQYEKHGLRKQTPQKHA